MKRVLWSGLVMGAVLAIGLGGTAMAEHAYVGPAKCKMCHKSAEAGEQYQKWEAGPHARAYKTLGTEEAKAAAKAKGIEDPQNAPECLKCHVTGYGMSKEILGEKWSMEDGVTCESCHGFGGDYYKKSVMEDREASIKAGLVIPDEKVCKGCHNEESPSYKPFDFEKFSAQIAHNKP